MTTKRTFSMLVGSALRATLVVLAAKVLSVILLANLEGATVQLRAFAKVVPYLSVSSPPTVFLGISTYSTLVMAVAAALYLVPSVIRPHCPTQRTWGRIVGVVVTAETFALQAILHYLGWTNLRVDRAWWIGMAVLGGILLGAAGLGFDAHAEIADPGAADPGEQPRSPLPAAA